jgi:flagellar hook-associated protein 2
MTTSIGYALGAGSGLDIQTLVNDLAAAAKAPREALIAKRETANQAKISTLAQVSGAIDSFASALTQLLAGGTLYSQPSVSDAGVFTASSVAGARIGALSASVEVHQLAQAQTLASAPLLSRTDPVGQGVLTIVTGGTSVDVAITAANDNLDGLARAINDKAAGVTASVVTDSSPPASSPIRPARASSSRARAARPKPSPCPCPAAPPAASSASPRPR